MTDCRYVATHLCEHLQIYGSCWYCKIDDQIKKLTDTCGSLNNRINALHDHKIRQIDENRKISIRMDEFEKLAKFNMSSEVQELLIFNLKMINERLENLENPENDKSHHVKMWDEVHERLDRFEQSSEARARSNKEIFERLQEIERFQDITHLEYQNRNKKPHKCPVCDGSTYRSEMTFHHCNVCEGKGIVWI